MDEPIKQKKNFIIYHVGHYGFLINCFLHKLVYHSEDSAVFLFDRIIADGFTVKQLLQVKGNFRWLGNIYIYNDREINQHADSVESTEKYIIAYFDRFLL